MSPQLTLRGIWRWYWALLVANALDLLLTYVAVQRGLQETNRVLQPILFTPWPIVLKFSALGILAVGLLYVTPTGRRPLRTRGGPAPQGPPVIALVGAGVESPRTGAEVDARRLLAVGVHGVAQHDAVHVVGEALPQPFPRAAAGAAAGNL